MRLDRKELGAACSICPLRGGRRVPGTGPNIATGSWSGLVLIGESPGSEETAGGRPFVGSAGRLLDSLLHQAGVVRESCWITNLIGCQPPGNKIDSEEGRAALEACGAGREAEFRKLAAAGARVWVPLGSHPLSALGVVGGITSRRGYVYERAGRLLVPTYHPSYLLRGSFEEIPTAVGDLKKARRILFNGWTRRKPKFTTSPSLPDLRAFADRVIRRKTLLGLDIETTSLIPERGEIIVVGLATGPREAVSFPLLKQGGARYWKTAAEESEVRRLLKKILAACPVVVHNGVFDLAWLRAKNIPALKLAHDTILLHHALHPELPHRLSYVASVYAEVEYWKDTLEDKTVPTLSLEDSKLREYNLWDAAVLLEILPKMLADAEALGVLEPYETVTIPLVEAVLEMTRTGLRLDRGRQRAWQARLEKEVAAKEAEIRALAGLPAGFSLGSGDHLGFLFFGEAPAGLERARSELALKEEALALLRAEQAELEGCPERTRAEERRLLSVKGQILRKETAKNYRDLLARADVLGVTPLRLPTGTTPHRTDTGRVCLDDEALLGLKTRLNSRILAIRGMRRPPRGISEEAAGLERSLAVVTGLMGWRETAKLLSTYGDFETWEDGRVHFPFKMTGTATGRLSSGDKKSLGVGNGQNIPEEARALFVEDGWIIGADYASLEPRVLAYISEDEPAIADFEKGLKPYDSIMQNVLGLKKADPDYDAVRRAMKIYVLGTNYGGSLETVYSQMSLKLERLPFSLARLREIHEERLRLHPAYRMWYNRTVEQVRKTRELRTFTGRRRVFLGSQAEIVRAALDFGPQGGAADVINQATVRLLRERDRVRSRARLALQVHDALYLVLPADATEAEIKKTARMLKTAMEAPIDVGKYENVTFPVEVSVGRSWGEMEEVEI